MFSYALEFSYDLDNLDKRLSRLELKKSLWEEDSFKFQQDFLDQVQKYGITKQASAVIQELSTKERLKMATSVEETITWAVRLLLKEEFSFKMDFVQRRNQWECDFKLIDPKGLEVDIKNGTGGGILDVISFSLYILFYKLFSANNRLPVILDEPLKHVSTEIPEYAERTNTFLRGLSERLGVQMILVTHQEPLIAAADKAFKMEMSGTKTVVTDITIPRAVYSE